LGRGGHPASGVAPGGCAWCEGVKQGQRSKASSCCNCIQVASALCVPHPYQPCGVLISWPASPAALTGPCNANQYESTPPNPTTDRVCTDCSHEWGAACTACSANGCTPTTGCATGNYVNTAGICTGEGLQSASYSAAVQCGVYMGGGQAAACRDCSQQAVWCSAECVLQSIGQRMVCAGSTPAIIDLHVQCQCFIL
jgi:hypothetical protein